MLRAFREPVYVLVPKAKHSSKLVPTSSLYCVIGIDLGSKAWQCFNPISLYHAKHEFKKNCAKIIQKATIFQSPTQQAYPIILEILYYEKDRKTVLFVTSLLKSLTQTIANPQK